MSTRTSEKGRKYCIGKRSWRCPKNAVNLVNGLGTANHAPKKFSGFRIGNYALNELLKDTANGKNAIVGERYVGLHGIGNTKLNKDITARLGHMKINEI
jgi:hypothetical protein